MPLSTLRTPIRKSASMRRRRKSHCNVTERGRQLAHGGSRRAAASTRRAACAASAGSGLACAATGATRERMACTLRSPSDRRPSDIAGSAASATRNSRRSAEVRARNRANLLANMDQTCLLELLDERFDLGLEPFRLDFILEQESVARD